MRIDRLLALGLARCGKPADKPRLPILMYHQIAGDAERGVSPYYRLCTSPRRFADQMQWLADSGWRVLGVTAALAEFRRGARDRICALSFDDGYQDFDHSAAPVLRRHGFSATVYLPSGYLDDRARRFRGAACLTWAQVRQLHADGIEFGSHTVSHPKLYELSWKAIRHELRKSRLKLALELGIDVRGFAYPYAFPQADADFRARLSDLLRELGYQHAVTTMVGRATGDGDSLCLPRLPVNDADDRALFLAKLEGAYDWMALPQAWVKSVRHFFRMPATPRRVLLPNAA